MEGLQQIVNRMRAYSVGVHTIAIDGRSASGKTSLAKLLAEEIGAEVIHMDDFFLPKELRTEERLSTPGGNVHYERFKEQVLPFLENGEPFTYQKFDCSVMEMGEECQIGVSKWRIVEGAYSCHPILQDYMDLRVFLDVSSKEQMARILERDGNVKAKAFEQRWIPMEEAYFVAYGIKSRADIVVMSPDVHVK